MDYSQLSKEELIALLSKNTKEVTDETKTVEEENQCLYTPKTGKDRQRCKNPADENYYGFCSKHKNTAQAKAAKEEYEKKQEEEVPEEEVSDDEEEVDEDEEVDEEEVDEEEDPREYKKITAKKNKWGYYEHEDTGMCFDVNTKKVLGRMNHRKGILYALSAKDKKICDDYGMSYSDSDEE